MAILSPKDFRIGNYLQDAELNMIYMIVGLTSKNFQIQPIIQISLPPNTKFTPMAIPVDIQFFQNVGFEYHDDVPLNAPPFLSHKDISMTINVEHNKEEKRDYFYWENEVEDLQINYVHEFQNLYHSLTGNEIVIQVQTGKPAVEGPFTKLI